MLWPWPLLLWPQIFQKSWKIHPVGAFNKYSCLTQTSYSQIFPRLSLPVCFTAKSYECSVHLIDLCAKSSIFIHIQSLCEKAFTGRNSQIYSVCHYTILHPSIKIKHILFMCSGVTMTTRICRHRQMIVLTGSSQNSMPPAQKSNEA